MVSNGQICGPGAHGIRVVKANPTTQELQALWDELFTQEMGYPPEEIHRHLEEA